MKIYESAMAISEAILNYNGNKWVCIVCNNDSCYHSFFTTLDELKELYFDCCKYFSGVKMLKISDNQFD